MTQHNFAPDFNPDDRDGADLPLIMRALHSTHIGTSAPSYAVKGTVWLKEITNPAPMIEIYLHDGSDDHLVATLDSLTTSFNLSDSMFADKTEAETAQNDTKAMSAVRTYEQISKIFSGSVAFFAVPTPPLGWIKANGAELSRTTYSDLFAVIGTSFGQGDGVATFNIPDLRGEFLRGWDDGRGVDAGRGFGTWQQSTRVYGAAYQPGVGFGNSFYDADVAPALDADGNTPLLTGSGGHASRVSNGPAAWAREGRYIRPRNQALLACIKY